MNLPARVQHVLPWLALAVIAVGFTNFVWVLAEASWLGGNAQGGYVADGHYFLHDKASGTFTEVSREVWTWSYLHLASLVVTHPLMLAAGAYLLLRHLFPSLAGLPADGDEPIVSSGEVPVAQARTYGRIGEVRMTWPLLKVTVYADAVVIRPSGWGRSVQIPQDRLLGLTPTRRWGAHYLQVDHDMEGTPQIWIGSGPDSSVGKALRKLVAGGRPGPPPVSIGKPPYPAIVRATILVGFGLSVAFVVWALAAGPVESSGFGLLWRLGLVAILAINVYQFFIRDRDRWG